MHNQYDLWILTNSLCDFQTLWNTNDKVNHQLKKKNDESRGVKRFIQRRTSNIIFWTEVFMIMLVH